MLVFQKVEPQLRYNRPNLTIPSPPTPLLNTICIGDGVLDEAELAMRNMDKSGE